MQINKRWYVLYYNNNSAWRAVLVNSIATVVHRLAEWLADFCSACGP